MLTVVLKSLCFLLLGLLEAKYEANRDFLQGNNYWDSSPPTIQLKTIDKLGSNPLPSGVRKLSGEKDLFRVRVGDYRVIYQISAARLIILVVRTPTPRRWNPNFSRSRLLSSEDSMLGRKLKGTIYA
jgi:mRNA-degrading endonuclease RelE of RelBE toxin-antitoxin system